MNFVRTIINSDKLKKIVNIPDEMKHQNVELLILPIDKNKESTLNFNPDEYRGTLKIREDQLEKDIQSIRSSNRY